MRVLLAAIIATLLQFGNAASAAAQSDSSPDGRVISGAVPLRLRAGPGLNYAVLDLLDDGTSLSITARSPDSNWLEVHTDDPYRLGWVYSDYVAAFIDLNTLPSDTGPLNFRNSVSGLSDNARRIFAHGQSLGNQPNIFAKVGDSITVSNHVLVPIGEGHFDLGEYDYLQPVIGYFSSASIDGDNSFTRTSRAAGVGWNAAAALLPQFANQTQCLPDESPLVCEYRLIHPAFALIMFGTNDVGYVPEVDYRHNLERIVQVSIDMGVVPVLSTIPPRRGYEDGVVRFNQIVRDIARQYDIPLWDYGYAMSVYEQTSLGADGVHPSLPARGHDDVAVFREQNLSSGYVLRNLTALHVLDALWRDIVLPGQNDDFTH